MPSKCPDDPIPDAYCDTCPTNLLEEAISDGDDGGMWFSDEQRAHILLGKYQAYSKVMQYDELEFVEAALEKLGYQVTFDIQPIGRED